MPQGDEAEIVIKEWSSGLAGIDGAQIKAALDHCRMHLEWPPSIAEFRRLCFMAGGLPSPFELMQKAIRREFDHPLTKMVFDKIGSWSFRNDTEKALTAKIDSYYKYCMAEFSADPQYCWKVFNEWKGSESST
jgi:hypothetical protein